MRIVFDANVLAAAFAARGLCADLLEVCLAEHDPATSESILDETGAALRQKIRLPTPRVLVIQAFLEEHMRVVIPTPVGKAACRDQSDLSVLGTAVAAQADFLVSGDKDLLAIEVFRSIPILSPRALWERLRQTEEK